MSCIDILRLGCDDADAVRSASQKGNKLIQGLWGEKVLDYLRA
jgi:hypothetical protein